MASIKAVYQNGKVYLQAIHQRKKSTKKLFDLDKKYWQKGRVKNSHPNSYILNRLLSSRIEQAEERLYQLMIDGSQFAVNDLTSQSIATKSNVSVCDSIQQIAGELKGTMKVYRKMINLKNHFAKFGDMDISSFGISELKRFESYLNGLTQIRSLNTSARYLKDLKRALNNQEYYNKKVINYTLKYQSTINEKCTQEEIDKMIEFDVDDYNLSRDMFISCFYTWGSRISSILTLKPENIKEDRLVFLEYKGRVKRKSVKINETLLDIIEKYKGQSPFYLFPILTHPPIADDNKIDRYKYNKHIESKTSIINKDLKVIAASCGINKRLSTHIARHSFAYISHKNGVETRLIQKMLGHTTFQMTENYIKSLIIDDELDDAAGMVY